MEDLKSPNFFKKNKGIVADFNKKIIDSAPISIITIDKNGVITFVNKYFENFADLKQVIGKNVFHLPFFIREGLCPLYRKLLSDGTLFEKSNCKTKSPSGELRYLSIVAVPLRDKNGNIDGALSMATDVTETVIVKMELARINNSLKERVTQKTQQLMQANEKLKRSLELKSHFISDASHELRTPLSIAKLNLEFFRKQFSNYSKDKEALESLNAIDNEINKVSNILSDLSFFTAVEESSVEKMNIEKIDLNKFMENIAERVRPLAAQKNIKIFFQKNKLGIEIKGDRIKLEKLFLNIIANAVKYGKNSGWVKIKIEPDLKNKSIKIIISDNGIGILKEDLLRIFDRFYRTVPARQDGEGGFGLGLSICKWIVEQHNGKIVAESVFGKGSVFTITLPINRS
ncbi:MAG: hypothetical protein A2528_03235 [Candidatus Staskawiczbacteria bacterium RIFOXYD2_FULL_37_9]|uniref:histidine kinase n=1 Tax=Candidatus Staskawiczbacteria bacterium RIFOXYB1_FULL_37_44 TaxID=1802223 RepID=A0A1G2IXU3_9BACT|nr:MAG: hypothetical protein A2358_00555 [Candidatus Staskawiczbacteria bacterium RIFOXYB1_FULL_37_44]OGZ83501.1 MAG: hypothetical protein A2416_04220 [Candidatus Staskawiczbacteria bacterium RIFOXYC1_FULL_37_52]OGZ87929.1 MAG: hypothetical protein A2444_02165 [Candidatus Staskawiczbacteria bacterium RIFOXYC2_FULL_37_19]OGZ90161.1 MAG: hypothetical protein A2581_01980 [Candidatus Staskawiczbacteria bacterium RIFOXYD1_FULL_37_110]OGZ93723.1 MAG: hypothetical protein A2528_03235 [Candidatus Stask